MIPTKTLRFIILGLLGVSLTWGLAAGRTWEIRADGSGDAPSVQAGIDSSCTGDTVLVQPGTYAETIDFMGKDIIVRSVMGPGATTLDASGAGGFVVSFQSGESRAAVIEGFTLTNGNAGVLIFNAEPTVLNNTITDNSGNFSGGGIWCGGQTNAFPEPVFHPLIQGNTITGNTADRIAGGIGTWRRMAPEILDNYIAGNVATDGDGGGIYFRALPDDTGAIIRGNIIENNYAGDHGGGFYAASALTDPLEFEFSWNVVNTNRADGLELTGDSGGGVWLAETNAWVHHNTIVLNTGNGIDSSYGGGIVVERVGSPIIEQNIIALSKNGGGIECGDGATPVIRDNLAWQNLPSDGVGDCADWWQTDGNILADPYFCDAENGDFTLAEDSPAITHPAGPLGAFTTPGCGPVPVKNTTWGSIKSKYVTKP